MALLNNNEYKLTVKISGQNYIFDFISQLSPFYCSIRSIKSNRLLGDLLKNCSDKDIMFMIYENSVLADEIAATSNNEFDSSNPPFYVREYVKEKTKYDLIFQIYLESTSSSGKTVELADFSIKQKKTSSFEDLLDILKRNLERWEDALRGLNNRRKAKPKHVLKSEKTSYPLSERTF